MLLTQMILLLLGFSLGSFLSACAYRVPRGVSVVTVPSSCPHCRAKLTWYELIPLASFLIQRGRCRTCSMTISWRYPLSETLVAAGTVFLFQLFGLTGDFLLNEVLFLIMFLVCLIDWAFQTIPNRILLSAAVIGISLKALIYLPSLPDALISAFLCFGVVLSVRFLAGLVLKRESLGMGDVKLAWVLGLFLGVNIFLVAFWSAAVFGATYGLTRRTSNRGDPLPFGSFLAANSVAAFIFEREINGLIEKWSGS